MKPFLSLLLMTALSVVARAQTPTPAEVQNQVTTPEDAQKQIPADNPIPVQPSISDAPQPCPSGVGKSCALLGGRLYFSDPLHMTEHDKTFWAAATSKGMLGAYAFHLTASILDIEGTEACLHAHTCVEMDPIYGSHPSRARAYGTEMPLSLASYAAAAMLKKWGKGNLAFAILWGGSMGHLYFGVSGFADAHNQTSPTLPTAAR